MRLHEKSDRLQETGDGFKNEVNLKSFTNMENRIERRKKNERI